MSEWISVKDRMPGDDEAVMVAYLAGCVDMAYMDEAFGSFMSHTSGDYPEVIDGVTHWMPLPEPPEA